MTSKSHFSFRFPEEMDGLIDFFVPNLFLGTYTIFKKYKNAVLKTLIYTPVPKGTIYKKMSFWTQRTSRNI